MKGLCLNEELLRQYEDVLTVDVVASKLALLPPLVFASTIRSQFDDAAAVRLRWQVLPG